MNKPDTRLPSVVFEVRITVFDCDEPKLAREIVTSQLTSLRLCTPLFLGDPEDNDDQLVAHYLTDLSLSEVLLPESRFKGELKAMIPLSKIMVVGYGEEVGGLGTTAPGSAGCAPDPSHTSIMEAEE